MAWLEFSGNSCLMQTVTPPRTQVLGQDQFRNLGFPGIVVAIFVSSFFAAQAACDLTVLILHGPHAFFAEGLRVADWKHSILSNGARLPWWGTLMIGPPTVPFTVLLVFGAEFAAGRVRAFLGRRPPWATAGARFVGGTALLGFSFWFFCSPQHAFPFLHPVPLSAFIGGAVLISESCSQCLWQAFLVKGVVLRTLLFHETIFHVIHSFVIGVVFAGLNGGCGKTLSQHR